MDATEQVPESVEVPDGDAASSSGGTRDITDLFLSFFNNREEARDLDPEVIVALNEAMLEFLRIPNYPQHLNAMRVIYRVDSQEVSIRLESRGLSRQVRNREDYVTEEFLNYDEDDFL